MTDPRDAKPCIECGVIFTRPKGKSRPYFERRQFCSQRCNGLHHRTPAAVRLWARVAKQDGDGCWEWTGGGNDRGYGTLYDGEAGSLVYAHRLSWEIANREPAGERVVCHRCDNPPCVRPDHLFIGDTQANTADMVAKRRHAFGERNVHAKLTGSAAREIRDRHAAGEGVATLAAAYGISRSIITAIINWRIWRLAGGAPRPNVERIGMKVTIDQAAEIRRLRQSGMQLRPIAERFGISVPNVHRIVHQRPPLDLDDAERA